MITPITSTTRILSCFTQKIKVRSAIYYCGLRKGCRGEFLPRQKKDKESSASALEGVCLQFRPLVSANRQKELRDSQPQNHLRLCSPKEPQGGHLGEATDGGAASTPRSSPAEAANPSTPRPAPRLGCVFGRGRGARRPCQSLLRGRLRISVRLCAPSPRASSAPARASAEQAEKWGLGSEPGKGLRGSGPRNGRSPRASTTAAPRLPQPQSPRWLPRTHSLRHLLHWDAAVASAAGTPVAVASSSRPRARSQLQILRWAPGNCQFQLPQQPGSCSSQPPRANCRRRRRRRLGSDCLRQPGTSRLRPAPLRSPAPLAAPPACPGPAPARTAGFLCCWLRPLPDPPPQRWPAAPVPGRVPLPGTRCSLCGETFLRAALGPLLSPGGGGWRGRRLRSRVPELTRVAAPTHPVTARP